MITGGSPSLSVGILLCQRSVEIGGTRGFRVVDMATSVSLASKWSHERLTIEAWMAGLRCCGRDNIRKLSIRPATGGFVLVNGKPYRGSLEIHHNGRGALNVVNLVDVESYLKGVVKAEMSASAPMEALKAQAIAARTFAIKNRDTFKARGYGLKANEQSQVYGGVAMEDPRTTKAVSDTRGIVVTYEGELAEALFHAACGGVTENNEDVWDSQPVPYERAVPCAGCQKEPTPPWKAEFPYGTIAKRLRQYQWNVGDIYQIIPTYTRTGRVKDVIVQSTTGATRIPGNNFRIIIDRHAIRSLRWMKGGSGASGEPTSGWDENQFDLGHRVEPTVATDDPPEPTGDVAIRSIIGRYVASSPTGRVFSLAGRGWGHGVGLCQWGAKVLASTGRTHQEILRYYYRGVGLARAY